VTPEIRDQINRKASLDDIKRTAQAAGFRSMYDKGLVKVKAGVTTLEEISTVTRTEY